MSELFVSNLCASLPRYPLPDSAEELEQALLHANEAMPSCLRNADFFAWRGALQMALAQYTSAAESLERALLINPDLPAAQLDYAQVLLTQGDVEGARQLLDMVAARPDLPDHLAPALQKSREQLAQGPVAVQTTATRWQLSTALAHDSNLNNAPAASQLTLTFPQGPVTLPLEKEFQSKSGAAWLNAAQWQLAHAVDRQVFLLAADVRSRTTSQNGSTGYLQSGLSGYWMQDPAADSQWVGQLSWGQLRFGNQRLYSSDGGSLQRQWKIFAEQDQQRVCRLGVGAEIENRRYPTSPSLNGLYRGLLLSANCAHGGQAGGSSDGLDITQWFDRPQYGLLLRVGEDQARASGRAGGRYQRAELRLSWEARVGVSRLLADYNWTRQLDSEGYSPLFDNNARRNSARHGVRVTLAYPLPQPQWKGAELFASLELSRQNSNLPAFQTRQKTIMTGLRWDLP